MQAGAGPVPLRWEVSPLALGDAAVSARAFSFDAMAVTQPVAASDGVLHYQDQVLLSPVGEVELRVEEAPGVWLRGSRGPTLLAAGSSLSIRPRPSLCVCFRPTAPSTAAGFAVDLQVAASESPRPPAAIAPPKRWPVPLLWLVGAGCWGR